MAEHPFTLEVERDHAVQLGRIAGALVHELKNPLGVILLNAELLANNVGQLPAGAERERMQARVRRIHDSGRNLQEIVQSFLNFARPARPDPEAVDVNHLLSELLDEQAELSARDGVTTTLHADPHLPQVAGDPIHLRSVFSNILTNAREALRERPDDRRMLIITRSAPQAARVVIANNGPPLPERVAARLFQPFTTTKEGGTGLGLAIVRRLVELHGGTVSITSDKDQGVSVTIEFPTTLPSANPRIRLPAPASTTDPALKKSRGKPRKKRTD